MLLHHRSDAPPFRIERRREAGAVLIEISGELDLATVPVLEGVVDLACLEEGPVLVDLCDASFVDSTGLRSLMTASRRVTERGRRFGVASSRGGQFAQLLETTRSNGLFACYADRATALDALSA